MLHAIRTRIFLLVAAGAIAVGAASTGAVAAASPRPADRPCSTQIEAARSQPSLESLKAVGDCQIERRFVTLDRLDGAITASAVLTAEHKRLLMAVNDTNPASTAATRAGLQALKGTIDGETDLAALRAEVGSIATDFRVYLLVVPKAHLVRAADATAAVAARFGPLADELAAQIERAKAAGKDVTTAEAALADLKAKVAEASGLVDPLAGRLLPLSVAQFNDGSAGPVMRDARAAIVSARGLLRAARADAHEVIRLLHA